MVVVNVSGQANAETRGINAFRPLGFLGYQPAHLVVPTTPASADSSGNAVINFTGLNFGPPSSNLVVELNRAGVAPYICRVQVRPCGFVLNSVRGVVRSVSRSCKLGCCDRLHSTLHRVQRVCVVVVTFVLL